MTVLGSLAGDSVVTNCKLWFLAGHDINTMELVKDILSTEGFQYTDLGSETTGYKLDVKYNNLNLSTTLMASVKSTAQDLGIYLKWV